MKRRGRECRGREREELKVGKSGKWKEDYLGLNITDDNLYFLEYPGCKLAE